ncbi:MAG TPA: hypothetical protein D7H95_05405 [Candidatus Poseidoniales archaeon]|nr:MAG TPA: hypothetical protein D7H95_05405 [Candidatus Poseidoniales archaeon]
MLWLCRFENRGRRREHQRGIELNIYGAIIFVIFAGGSGLFAILALTNDATAITTDGTVMEGTTWDEYEGTREECAEMGYYYDEYGDEYQECDRYETITYYKCSSGVDFSYTLADDPNGTLIAKEETIGWLESPSSCLNDIKSVYAVNQTVTVHYLSTNPEDGSLTEHFPPGVGYFCCSLCFGLLAIPALVLMLTKRGPSVGVKTGGMLAGMRPQRVPITTPTDSNTMGAQPMYEYPNPQSTGQNNQSGGMRGGGMGAGGMMMMASGAAGGAAYNPSTHQAQAVHGGSASPGQLPIISEQFRQNIQSIGENSYLEGMCAQTGKPVDGKWAKWTLESVQEIDGLYWIVASSKNTQVSNMDNRARFVLSGTTHDDLIEGHAWNDGKWTPHFSTGKRNGMVFDPQNPPNPVPSAAPVAGGMAASNANTQTQDGRRKRYSPSKMRGYDRIINQLRLKDQTLSSQGEAIQRIMESNMMDAKTATQFVTSPYVLKALGLAGAAGAGAAIGAGVNQASQTSESRLESMKKEAAAFFDSAKPKVNTTPSRPVAKGESDQCQHPSCSTSVSAFDFRCFDCRRRFCSAHKGTTFQCADCAD